MVVNVSLHPAGIEIELILISESDMGFLDGMSRDLEYFTSSLAAPTGLYILSKFCGDVWRLRLFPSEWSKARSVSEGLPTV